MNRFYLAAIICCALMLAACGSQQPPATTSPNVEITLTPTSVEVNSLPQGGEASATPQPAAADPTQPPPPTATPTPLPSFEAPYSGISLDMLAALNYWRINSGLAPFQRNETLDAMAQAQAQYVASLANLPDDFHADGSGSGVFQRAAELGWPHYSNPQQIAVGEVAYVGANIGAALNFWQNSQIHNATITNTGFREIGIGVAPHVYGNVFMVVVGSRPNVLTALVDPATGRLYVTSEQYKWSQGGDWIHDATQLQVLDVNPSALDAAAWAPFQAFVAGQYTSTFYVALSDAVKSVVLEVNPYRDVAWLPSNLGSVGQSPTPAPTALPNASIAVVYDATSLSVINISGGPVDMSHLVIGEGATALPMTHWLAYFKNDPLVFTNFPAGECLQARAAGIAYPGPSAECSILRGLIQAQTDALFWKDTFNVYWQGQSVGQCPGGEARCDVRLP